MKLGLDETSSTGVRSSQYPGIFDFISFLPFYRDEIWEFRWFHEQHTNTRCLDHFLSIAGAGNQWKQMETSRIQWDVLGVVKVATKQQLYQLKKLALTNPCWQSESVDVRTMLRTLNEFHSVGLNCGWLYWILLHCCISMMHGFNMDTIHPLVYEDPLRSVNQRPSYFGYSVQFFFDTPNGRGNGTRWYQLSQCRIAIIHSAQCFQDPGGSASG